jgi:hypothetical protein
VETTRCTLSEKDLIGRSPAGLGNYVEKIASQKIAGVNRRSESFVPLAPAALWKSVGLSRMEMRLTLMATGALWRTTFHLRACAHLAREYISEWDLRSRSVR